MLTAEECKEKTKNQRLKHINEQIERAIELGWFSQYFWYKLDDDVVQMLKDNGFGISFKKTSSPFSNRIVGTCVTWGR